MKINSKFLTVNIMIVSLLPQFGFTWGGLFEKKEKGNPYFCSLELKDQFNVLHEAIYTDDCVEEGLRPAFLEIAHKYAAFRQLNLTFFKHKLNVDLKCEQMSDVEMQNSDLICIDPSADIIVGTKNCEFAIKASKEHACRAKAIQKHAANKKAGPLLHGRRFTAKELYNEMFGLVDIPSETAVARKILGVQVLHSVGADSMQIVLDNPRLILERQRLKNLPQFLPYAPKN